MLILSFVHQANNAYIFPGFGLGLIMSGTIRVHDDLLLAACKCMRFEYSITVMQFSFIITIIPTILLFQSLPNNLRKIPYVLIAWS